MNGLRAGTRKQIRGNVRRLQRETGAIGAEIGGALDLVTEQVNVLDGEQDFKRAARVHKTISDRWSQRKMDYMTLDLVSSATPHDPTLVGEVFSTTGRVCQAAEERGYKAMPLADLLTGFNLKTKAGQRKARHLVRQHKPHVLVVAFPCTAWCAVQNLNPDQQKVSDMQDEERVLLECVEKLADTSSWRTP